MEQPVTFGKINGIPQERGLKGKWPESQDDRRVAM
jgi:hypothetical protein